MNEHKIILPYLPGRFKRLMEIKKIIEMKVYYGEDIGNELKQMRNGSTSFPKGLQDIRTSR